MINYMINYTKKIDYKKNIDIENIDSKTKLYNNTFSKDDIIKELQLNLLNIKIK